MEEAWHWILGIRSSLVNHLVNLHGFIKSITVWSTFSVTFLFEIATLWWDSYGGEGIELQNLVTRVFSLVVLLGVKKIEEYLVKRMLKEETT